MIALTRFFEVVFDDKEISLDELVSYTTDHLQRMIANNPNGELDARITATTSAFTLLEGCVTGDSSKVGIRKGKKMLMRAFRDSVAAKVGKVVAAVAARYGMHSAEEMECCPQGRTIFSSCTDDTLAGHLQVLVDGVTAHVADLGAPLVAEATAIKAGWDAVYAASESSTGAATATHDAMKNAKENLTLMLHINLLTLGIMFARQPEKCAMFMTQSLLEDHPQQPPTPPPPPGP